MHPYDEPIALLVDGRMGYDLALTQGTLNLMCNDEPARIVPLRRVGRVILRHPRSAALRALLELTERGATIHFQDGQGHIAATLIPTDTGPDPAVRELIDRIDGGMPAADYAEWLDLQLRHGASRILRRGPRGGIELLEQALLRYAARGQDARRFNAAWNEVRALCFAWIDGQLTRLRLRALAAALLRHQLTLVRDLDRVLALPLLWNFAPWLRANSAHSPRERMEYFENQRRRLEPRLAQAISALHYHLGRPAKTPPAQRSRSVPRRRYAPTRIRQALLDEAGN